MKVNILTIIAKRILEPFISKDKHHVYFTCLLASIAFAFVEFFKLLSLLREYFCLQSISEAQIYEINIELIEVIFVVVGMGLLLFLTVITYNDKEH